MSSNLYILEGPDCTGKTTLAKYLAAQHGYTYWHCDGNPPLFKAMAEYQRNVLDNVEWDVKTLGGSWVIDRHWPSEYVYGRIFKRPIFEHEPLQARIRALGGVYIYCHCNSMLARHEAERDPAHPYDPGKYEQVCEGYQDLFKRIVDVENVIHYDLDVWGSKLDQFAKELGL